VPGPQRHKLTGKLTPVTAESFAAWKAARKAKKEQEERELREKKEAAIKAGKALGGIGVWPPGLAWQRRADPCCSRGHLAHLAWGGDARADHRSRSVHVPARALRR